tara:strand:+ start:93 stop:743 length:651 start_codon:yes stop_codon:yes gene_type:complete
MGCDPNSNTINPNSNGTNHDWYFEIKVDGVPHRIEGSIEGCYNFMYNNNKNGVRNYFYNNNSSQYLYFESTNFINQNYISGDSFNFNFYQEGLSIGYNEFDINDLNGSQYHLGINQYTGKMCSGVNFPYCGFSLQPLDTNEILDNKFPINITQLPSVHQYNTTTQCFDVGIPIIGSGSQIIYVLDSVIQQSNGNEIYMYRRPYDIEIKFKTYWITQ